MPTTHNIVKNMEITSVDATTAPGNGNVAGLLGGWMKFQPNASGNVILSGTVQTTGAGEGYRLCYNAGEGTFQNNYVNPAVTVNGKTVSGGTASDGQGADMTEEQMGSKEFYANLGFDFDAVFDWDNEAKTPVLKDVDQTVVAPSEGPAPGEADVKNVTLTIGADETQRRLSWYTDSKKTGEVQLALATDMTSKTFPEHHLSFESSSKISSLGGYYSNQAVITGLAADTPAKLLIDQVYGDGGKGETPISNSFIELYNPNETAVSLDGYTLTYGEKTLVLDSEKSIPAKGSYLIVGASAETTKEYQTYNLPEADQICDWQISNKNYTISLKKDKTVLDTVAADENIEEIKISKQKTLQRVNHVDTDKNDDFRIVVWKKGEMTATAENLAQYAPHNSKGAYGSLVATEPEYTPVKTSDTRVKGYYDANGSLKLELAGRYNSELWSDECGRRKP